MHRSPETSKGLWATTAAFVWWGFVPVYWKAIGEVPADEMIGWRVVWALPFLALLLQLTRGWTGLLDALRSRRTLGVLAVSAVLVAGNWYVFIRAMDDDQVLQASLGYYINPFVNVVLGFAFLGERPRRMQWLAIAIAASGVAVMIVAAGEVPWVALFLAVTFGLYGLVRKLARVEALPGLTVEVLWLLVPGILWLLMRSKEPGLTPLDLKLHLLVPLAGLITAGPLGFFAYGARRLPLVTVGILQFIAPTGQFLLAILAYGEPFTSVDLATFGLIWIGVAVYLVDLLRRRGRDRAAQRSETVSGAG